MAYQIKLNIKGETCVFTRNGEPTLRDTTNALKVQQQQLRMLNRKDGLQTMITMRTRKT